MSHMMIITAHMTAHMRQLISLSRRQLGITASTTCGPPSTQDSCAAGSATSVSIAASSSSGAAAPFDAAGSGTLSV